MQNICLRCVSFRPGWSLLPLILVVTLTLRNSPMLQSSHGSNCLFCEHWSSLFLIFLFLPGHGHIGEIRVDPGQYIHVWQSHKARLILWQVYEISDSLLKFMHVCYLLRLKALTLREVLIEIYKLPENLAAPHVFAIDQLLKSNNCLKFYRYKKKQLTFKYSFKFFILSWISCSLLSLKNVFEGSTGMLGYTSTSYLLSASNSEYRLERNHFLFFLVKFTCTL